ncbi:hypothetical protein JYK22_24585, partial [Nonomuraea sp. RK-328]|nr:hypothetical protein [Nonomuraea sp. RK-328]
VRDGTAAPRRRESPRPVDALNRSPPPHVSTGMMVRILAVLGLVSALLTVFGGTAGACSCGTPPPRVRMAEADAVFTATVTRVRVDEPMEGGGRVTAFLRADHVYKGRVGAEVEVSTRAQSPACGYDFDKGDRYLIFAAAGEDAGLTTSLCSGNRLIPAGDKPLRLSDETWGMGALTPELFAALGKPTPVHAAEPRPTADATTGPLTASTGTVGPISASYDDSEVAGPAMAVVAGVLLAAGLAWAYKRARAGRRS